MSSSYCSFIDMTGEKAKVIPTSKACFFFISRFIQRLTELFGRELEPLTSVSLFAVPLSMVFDAYRSI